MYHTGIVAPRGVYSASPKYQHSVACRHQAAVSGPMRCVVPCHSDTITDTDMVCPVLSSDTVSDMPCMLQRAFDKVSNGRHSALAQAYGSTRQTVQSGS
jgi:hypothetical protein